ncbi:MAG: GAF domain-containing protein [Nanoarchaeota archaeon]
MELFNKESLRLADNLPMPLLKVELDGTIEYVNTVAANKLGYNKRELVGNRIYNLFVEETKDKLKKYLLEFSSRKRSELQEYYAIKKNGKLIPLAISRRVVQDHKSGHRQVIVCFFDISERKKSEENVKKSREELKSLHRFNEGILDGISDELIVMDAKTRYIEYANNKVLQRTGLTREQIKKKRCFQIYHEHNHFVGCKASEVIYTGFKKDYEIKVYNKAKKIHNHLHVSVHPIMDETGKARKIIHLTKDITNKKSYEKKLAELNDRLLRLYKISSSLQRAISMDKICTIAVETFESLGFDRIRIYRYDNNTLTGIFSNHIPKEKFQSFSFKLNKRHKKAYNCIHKKRPVIEKTKRYEKLASFLEKPSGLLSGSLPLISENKVFGMISFDNKMSGKEIVEKDLDLYMTFANQIASAMQRSEFIKENEKKVHRLSTLYDIYSTINQTLDMENIMNMIVIRIVKLLKIDRCSLLLETDKKELTRLAVFDRKDAAPEINKKLPLGDSVSSKVLKTNKPCYIKDIKKSKDYAEKEQASAKGLVSYLGLPLSIENRAIGVINIHSRTKRIFSENEMNLLMALCSTASMMIENSWLYERIKYDKNNFSELLDITQRIGLIHNIKELVKEVLSQSVAFTGADHGFVMLLDNDHLSLTFSTGNPMANSKKMKFKVGTGVVGMVAKTGKTYIIDNVDTESNYMRVDKRVKSSATIPLLKKGAVMGVMHLESSRPEKFKYYAKSLGILTNHIAVAIENIRLYDQVLNFNRELERRIDEATKELQEKNKELRKMDEMKSDFVSNVSHELRTPLTSILGYTKLLHNGKLGELNDKQNNVLSTVVSESERLSRLINDVLDLSKLESGKIEIKFEKDDAGRIIKETVESLRHIAESKKIKLITRIEKNVGLETSPDLLKQAVINLVNNALKFTKENGRVTIAAKTNGNKVLIHVKDTGVGIPKEEVQKLFDKFYQVDSSMTREHNGTGLGLVIVKHIAELHNGTVKVNSKEGKGSRFTLELPVKQV